MLLNGSNCDPVMAVRLIHTAESTLNRRDGWCGNMYHNAHKLAAGLQRVRCCSVDCRDTMQQGRCCVSAAVWFLPQLYRDIVYTPQRRWTTGLGLHSTKSDIWLTRYDTIVTRWLGSGVQMRLSIKFIGYFSILVISYVLFEHLVQKFCSRK